MQAPKGSPSLASSTAQLTSERADGDRIAMGTAGVVGEKNPAKKSGISAGKLTGAAAIASATVVLPLVTDAGIANPADASGSASTQSAAQSGRGDRLPQSVALNQSKGVLPQIPQQDRAAFTAAPAVNQNANQTPTTFTSSNNDLIRQDADGHWTLAYATQTDSSTQSVVSQLASETSAAAGNRTCVGGDCRRLAYINRQLPAAQQTLQQAQQQLAGFEKEHAQSSLPTYKKVLSDRIGEISRQKGELINDIAETRGYIGQIRVRLSSVNVDLNLPEILLANNAEYQFTWADLQRSEEKLLEEYSKVNIDGTELNKIYAEYRAQQQKLEQSANNALSTYLLDENTPAPPIMYEAPAALDVLQALVVATHQEKVQLLRDSTIAELETRLRERQQILTRDISTHERLKRELNTAQASVDQYIEEREQIIANASAPQLAKQGAPEAAPIPAETLEEASFLQAQLPEGTIAKTLMGIVVAAGCIATVAHMRKKKPSVQRLIPKPQQTFSPQQPSIPLFAGQSKSVTQSKKQLKDEGLLGELMTLVETNTPVVPTLSTADIDLSIEIMARELDLALNPPKEPQPAAEEQFASEVANRNLESVQLSLKEIDIFAEKAIQWVLKDLTQGVVTPEAEHTQSIEQAVEDLAMPQLALAGALEYRSINPGTQSSGPKFATERFNKSRKRRTVFQLKSA